MSITFYPATVDGAELRPLLRCACELLPAARVADCAACTASLNVNNRNACDLLAYLGIESDPVGHIEADKLAELCELRLKLVHVEAAIPTVARGRYTECGRDDGYLPSRTRDLLVLAKMARGRRIAWS